MEKTVIVLIYILGFLSDINKLSSPIKRIILQVILLTAVIIISGTFVDSIRITHIDFLLKNYYFFKIFFSLFCLLVFINGSNFIEIKSKMTRYCRNLQKYAFNFIETKDGKTGAVQRNVNLEGLERFSAK